MPRPSSPPSDRRWQPRYPPSRDRPRFYRDFDDRDRDYDRRDRPRSRERDEYRPPPIPARGGTYRGRREYASPPPVRGGRDRSWERERDYRDRERDYERDRDRDLPRKRTRSPSPRRRFSPPPERYVPRVEYPPGYERPRRESTPRVAEVVEKVEEKKEVETGEYSEEEGMVTPPQGKKRKLEPEVEPPAEPVEPRKPRLVVVSESKKRILESPPHQSMARLPEVAQPPPIPTAEAIPPADVPTERSRSPIKISLPSLSLSNKAKPNTPTIPSGPAFGVEEKDERRPVSPPRYEDRHYRAPPIRDTRRPAAWASNERTDRGRDRRYSTSSSWASRSRSPPRASAVRPRSRSPDVRRRRSISPRPDPVGQRYRPAPRRSVSRSRSPRSTRSDSRSPRSRSPSRSRSRSTRSRSRSRISRSRTRSPVQSTAIRQQPPPFRRNVRPPTGPAAETPIIPASTVPDAPVRTFIPTGPRGRGRGPPIAPRAPRAERLGFVGGFRGAVRPPVGVSQGVQSVRDVQGVQGVQGVPKVHGVQNVQGAQGSLAAQSTAAAPIPIPASAVPPIPTPVAAPIPTTTVPPPPTAVPVVPTIPPAPPTIVHQPVVAVEPPLPPSEFKEPTPIPEPPREAPKEAPQAETRAPQAELMANREEKLIIQLKPEPPAPIIAPPKLLASSPVAMPQSSPATPFEKPTASPAKIGSSPMDRGSATPGPGPIEEKHEPARKPSFITLPAPSAHARSRASSSAIPPTPAARTPHPAQPPHNLRQATSYTRLPVWKEYPPPAEVRWRERPNAADGLDALQALGAFLPDDGYRGMADRDTTRIAGEWERQLMKLQHERALLTHSFQAIASSLRVKKFELGNALDEVWIAERKIEAAGMSMETAGFSPKRE